MENAEKKSNPNFGLVYHVGIYSIVAFDSVKSAVRRKVGNGSEWLKKRLLADENTYHPVAAWRESKEYFEEHFPGKEYDDLAEDFKIRPEKIVEWVRVAKEAGASYVILTSKHHDGFALWKTKTTKFHSKLDIVQTFKDATEKYGLIFGLYYSWYEFTTSFTKKFIEEIVKPQIDELIKYRPLIWFFDGGWDIKSKFGKDFVIETCKRIRKKIPGVIINDRLGQVYKNEEDLGHADFRVFSDRYIPTKRLSIRWEHCNTIGYSWGCNKEQKEEDYKTSEELVKLYKQVRKMGGKFLLNLGPDGKGKLDPFEVERLEEFGKEIKKLDESKFDKKKSSKKKEAVSSSEENKKKSSKKKEENKSKKSSKKKEESSSEENKSKKSSKKKESTSSEEKSKKSKKKSSKKKESTSSEEKSKKSKKKSSKKKESTSSEESKKGSKKKESTSSEESKKGSKKKSKKKGKSNKEKKDPSNLRIFSFNPNGIRALVKNNNEKEEAKGHLEAFVREQQPDIVFFPETKGNAKLEEEMEKVVNKVFKKARPDVKYTWYWSHSDKPGRFGNAVAVSERVEIEEVKYGFKKRDDEGRVIALKLKDVSLIKGKGVWVLGLYVPNASTELKRLNFKIEWMKKLRKFADKLREDNTVIIIGDINIAPEDTDIANPASNKRTPGFTSEEKDYFKDFLGDDYLDAFRQRHPAPNKSQKEKGAYTYWNQQNKSRDRNAGWRIDFSLVDKETYEIEDVIQDVAIYPQYWGSDHCPVGIEVKPLTKTGKKKGESS